MAKSFLNQNQYSRGVRNNNPLNLVYTGINWNGKIPYSQNSDWSGSPGNVVKSFEQFIDIEHGIRAAAMDILNDYTDGSDTIRAIVTERSPAYENPTEEIISRVSSATGLNPNTPFVMDSDILKALLQELIKTEISGNEYGLITGSDIESSINLLPAAIIADLGAFVQENKTGLLATALLLAGGVYALNKVSN